MRTLLLSLSLPWLLVACRTQDKVVEADTGALAGADTDADGDGVPASEDCDDADASINSGALEICDGLDNDCDGLVDEGVTTTFFEDADGDSYGDPDATVEACAQPSGTVSSASDCDDSDPRVFPGANEVCNDLDDNCDGEVDEGLLEPWYLDSDGDGFGDPAAEERTCAPASGWVQDNTDCDDATAAANPAATEFCDEIDNDCDGETDEGVTTTYWVDGDGDGFGDPARTAEACSLPVGYADVPQDCDDSAVDVNPDATELCNTVDDDCDGTIDEDDAADAPSWWRDADADGWGVSATSSRACAQPSGYVASGGDEDCDDANATTHPGASEYCDGEDDDCDGTIDEADALDAQTWWLDADSDGYGGSRLSATQCTAPAGYVGNTSDCDDLDGAVFPGATEVCNDTDDDCDGSTDEGLPTSTWYADADGDGYGLASTSQTDCAQPTGFVASGSDCDDGDSAISPAASEICDGVDNDCDGATDDDDSSVDLSTGGTWHVDADGDGFGDPSATIDACSQPTASSTDNTDCDDTDAFVRPDANGVCALGETCHDILDSGRGVLDGSYAIDPDGYGTGLDPFEVYCDMTTDGGGWTEIAYADDLSFQQHHSGGDRWAWVVDDFTFELSDAQIAAIQAVSLEGNQLYEGRCEHVVHYYYNAGTSYAYAFGFEFFDGTTTPRGQASYSPYNISVVSDGCAGNGGEGGSLSQTTDFEIDSVLVPIRNVQCRDCGDVRPESYGSVLTDNPAWLR